MLDGSTRCAASSHVHTNLCAASHSPSAGPHISPALTGLHACTKAQLHPHTWELMSDIADMYAHLCGGHELAVDVQLKQQRSREGPAVQHTLVQHMVHRLGGGSMTEEETTGGFLSPKFQERRGRMLVCETKVVVLCSFAAVTPEHSFTSTVLIKISEGGSDRACKFGAWVALWVK